MHVYNVYVMIDHSIHSLKALRHNIENVLSFVIECKIKNISFIFDIFEVL